jgi:hypothetical protein
VSTYAERLDRHEQFLAEVVAQLAYAGFHVCDFGASALSTPVRETIKLSDSGLRWLPDKVAAKSTHVPFCVDAKVRLDREAGNYEDRVIEARELRTQAALSDALDVPVVYVFDDWMAVLASVALAAARWRIGADRGSRTPYALVGEEHFVPFDQIVSGLRVGAS